MRARRAFPAFRATAAKELRLLTRDRAGLLILFLMPTVLVLVVTLVQENVMRSMGQASARVLLVDADGGAVSKKIREGLASRSSFTLTERTGPADPDALRAELTRGKYQFALLFPPGLSEGVSRRAAESASLSFPKRGDRGEIKPLEGATPELTVFFEPTVQGAFRSAVLASLREAALGVETEAAAERYAARLDTQLQTMAEAFAGQALPPEYLDNLPTFRPRKDRLLAVAEAQSAWNRPTSVQQNVPAWALFGMFFIAVPLAGALVRERADGLVARQLAAPASFFWILCGKIVAYACVCAVQFMLMLGIGLWVLPLLGAPALAVAAPAWQVAAAFACAALAATAYGLLLGAVSRTYEQASMFGSVSVVIAAALGGVMVPSYVMPPPMRAISQYSPLGWGLETFLDLFVRTGSLASSGHRLAQLLAFCAACLLVAWVFLVRRGAKGLP